jgi:alpha-glucosidase
MLLLTLRGTPTMYYGDELGLARVAIAPDDMRDPWERNEPGLGLSRDPSRTPMQWDRTRNAGFTDAARPWLPLDPAYELHNVAAMRDDPGSLLSLYRSLIALRRRHPALSAGAFQLLGVSDHMMIYARATGSERIVVALNFNADEQPLADEFAGAEVLVSTAPDRGGLLADARLRGDEGLVLRQR